jgi:hypothetical protein
MQPSSRRSSSKRGFAARAARSLAVARGAAVRFARLCSRERGASAGVPAPRTHRCGNVDQEDLRDYRCEDRASKKEDQEASHLFRRQRFP